MIGRGKIIPILIGAASLCAAAHADMVPLSPADLGGASSQQIRLWADSPSTSPSRPHLGSLESADFGLLFVGSWPAPSAQTGQVDETKFPQILADKQNSASLCLYALLGLGLCRSVPLVKRLHFGRIPDWYHSGSDDQIGHGLSAAPDYRWSVPTPYFAPLGHESKDISPGGLSRTMMSLLKGPQIASWELGSRGPP
jgi:hypothetical protein